MTAARLLTIVATGGLLLFDNAFAQSPVAKDRSHDAAPQTVATDKRGTQEAPLTVRIVPPPDAEARAVDEKRERDEKAAVDNLLVKWTQALYWATVALVVVAIVQAAFFLWQLRLMREGIDDASIAAQAAQASADSAGATVALMRATAISQQRAYTLLYVVWLDNIAPPLPGLNVPNPNPADVNFPNIGPRAFIEIKNSGQTPAYNVIHFANIEFREYPLQAPLTPRRLLTKGQLVSRQIIGPGDKGMKNLSLQTRLTAEQIAQLRARTHALYVYGKVFYRDAFKRWRGSSYCYFHNEGAPGHIGIATTLYAYDTGNRAT